MNNNLKYDYDDFEKMISELQYELPENARGAIHNMFELINSLDAISCALSDFYDAIPSSNDADVRKAVIGMISELDHIGFHLQPLKQWMDRLLDRIGPAELKDGRITYKDSD